MQICTLFVERIAFGASMLKFIISIYRIIEERQVWTSN